MWPYKDLLYILYSQVIYNNFVLLGIVDYCKRYAEGAFNVQKATSIPPPILYDVPTAEEIQNEFTSSVPLEKVAERRKWRDGRLAAISKLKRDLAQKE